MFRARVFFFFFSRFLGLTRQFRRRADEQEGVGRHERLPVPRNFQGEAENSKLGGFNCRLIPSFVFTSTISTNVLRTP